MEKATRSHTKEHNARLVLKTIYEGAGISRADIARSTNLTRPTVSALVAELLEEGLVSEQGMGPSAGGKPPILLTLAPDAYLTVCLDLGGDGFRGALVDLRGEIQATTTRRLSELTSDLTLSLVFELVQELVDASPRPLLGIGIGTPGLVDAEQGIVRNAVNLRWRDLPLASLLYDRFQLPVYVANDSHISALAELITAQDDLSNLIALKLDNGIGAGIVIDGKLVYGDHHGAGEVGHVVVVEDGQICTCGNRGCLETVASARAVLATAQRLAAEWQDSPLANGYITLKKIADAADTGDVAAQQVVREAGRYLGITIAHLIGALSVRNIVLSGQVTLLGEALLKQIRATTARRVLPAMAASTDIRFSALGDKGVLLGSGMMVVRGELGIV